MTLHHLFTCAHLNALYVTFKFGQEVIQLVVPGKGKHRRR
jgi:hypothetical protein